ncbi:MAG: hypothetical protein AAFW84_07900 [Cyanobacteria bacterium J06635_15]
MGRPVAVIVIAIVEAIAGAKKQAGNCEDGGKNDQNDFNIHAD